MKLTGRDAAAFIARPDAKVGGILLYGQDAMRVALKRADMIAALVGPQAEEEMRLERPAASEVAGNPALILDGIRAQGFFPGPRVIFIDGANDRLAAAFSTALDARRDGDAQMVVTAGALKPTSKLRKLFEGAKNAVAIGIYDDPPTQQEIEAKLRAAGLPAVPREIAAEMTALSRDLDPGEFAQVIEKLGLYKRGDDTPVSAEDLAACVPQSIEAVVDDVLNLVAEAQDGMIGPLVGRLRAQGIAPVTLCIGAMRHFRMLYGLAAAPGGPAQGAERMRPRLFGPRRDRVIRQASAWGAPRLEQALSLITDVDLSLRSAGQTAPADAVVERMLIRLARLARARL